MQFGRCDILNLLAEVPVTADEGWRWEISKVPRPGKFSPIKRRNSNGNIFTYFILLMATKWTQGFPMVGEKGSIPGRKDSENYWDGCFGIWLVKEPRENTLTWARDLNYACDLGQATSSGWVSLSPFEMEVSLKRRWEFGNRADLGWNLGAATCWLQHIIPDLSALVIFHP